jgi:ribonuclease T1
VSSAGRHLLARFAWTRAARKLGFVLVGVAVWAGTAQARSTPEMGTVALSSLPAEARQTEQLIRSGGPFPYAKDGVVFGNRERQLPRAKRGFYREYTVKTPGSRDRGPRRIVCGGDKATAPEACYYTADHYTSFKRIVQ